ncbi:MAG TPA: hypothetical protein PKC30_06360 [Saprospiraceae bacterium]|nr:hypothetical protein [Saprospiraceae bacterium]
MTNHNHVVLFSLSLFLIFSCSQDINLPVVEFKILDEISLVSGLCKIDEENYMTGEIIIQDSDILSYHPEEYYFTLSVSGIEKIKTKPDNAPFGLFVDDRLIYTGFIKPGFSSSSCLESITMDNTGFNQRITMSLGYPGHNPNVQDRRNNPYLIIALQEQGKLE